MATYNVQYRQQFRDKIDGMLFRIDFLLKDGAMLPEPFLIMSGDVEPLEIEWGNSEDLLAPVIGSKATIGYMFDGLPGTPIPETFINIEEDTWLIEIYRGEPGLLYWKGFIKPDNNSYPWLYPPYAFKINAVDFTFTKAHIMDLNGGDGLLYYGLITLGECIDRTLFASIGYDNPILRVLYGRKPSALLSQPITQLQMHTDAFYSLNDGPMFAYDVLEVLASSMQGRFFYANGTYWFQRMMEIFAVTQDIITITPEDLVGTQASYFDTIKNLGSAPGDDISYLNRSQFLNIDRPIKEQEANYELKAINQVQNFDWRNGSPIGPWAGWESNFAPDGTMTRIGAGSVLDPYKLRVLQHDPLTSRQIWSRLTVRPGECIEVNLRAEGLNADNMLIFAYLVGAGTTTDLLRRMDESGEWVTYQFFSITANAMRLSLSENENTGTLDVTSKPIPEIDGFPNLEVMLVISNVLPRDPVTPPVYVDLFPVFVRIFRDNYSDVETKIVSDKRYSHIPDKRELFFIDRQAARYSNSFFYNDVTLPNNDWNGETIQRATSQMVLDEWYNPAYKFTGQVRSNKLHFNNGIRLRDLEDRIMILLHQRYSVRSGTHDISAIESRQMNTGQGVYTELPIIRGAKKD